MEKSTTTLFLNALQRLMLVMAATLVLVTNANAASQCHNHYKYPLAEIEYLKSVNNWEKVLDLREKAKSEFDAAAKVYESAQKYATGDIHDFAVSVLLDIEKDTRLGRTEIKLVAAYLVLEYVKWGQEQVAKAAGAGTVNIDLFKIAEDLGFEDPSGLLGSENGDGLDGRKFVPNGILELAEEHGVEFNPKDTPALVKDKNGYYKFAAYFPLSANLLAVLPLNKKIDEYVEEYNTLKKSIDNGNQKTYTIPKKILDSYLLKEKQYKDALNKLNYFDSLLQSAVDLQNYWSTERSKAYAANSADDNWNLPSCNTEEVAADVKQLCSTPFVQIHHNNLNQDYLKDEVERVCDPEKLKNSTGFNVASMLISPDRGPVAGGTVVTLSGTDLTGAAELSIGGQKLTGFKVISSTKITAITPSSKAGLVSVVLNDKSGTQVANTFFMYLGSTNASDQGGKTPATIKTALLPEVTRLSPNTGPTAGGILVTIDGSGFEAGAKVAFGGVASTSVTVESSTIMKAVAPAGSAGAVSVQVTTAAGSSTANVAFTYDGTVESTKQLLSDFQLAKSQHFFNNQPQISGFVDGSGLGGGSLGGINLNGALANLSMNGNNNLLSFSFSGSLGRIWTEMERNEAKLLRNKLLSAEQGVLGPVSDQPNSELANDKTYGNTPYLEEGESLTAAQRQGYDVWTQIYGSRTVSGDVRSNLWVGYVGAHYYVTPDLIVGGLVQADWSEQTNNTAGNSADGFGWMFGPYIAAKLPGQPLYFDARAAWGQSDNKVSPFNTYKDSFDTERWMVSGQVSGKLKSGDWTIRPAVSVSYYEETQEAYTDNLANRISEQTFSQGEVRAGPTFSREYLRDDGVRLTPSIGVSGVWNFDLENNVNSQGTTLGTGDFRARFDAGIRTVTTGLWYLDVNGFYDGIGVDDYYSYGGRIKLTVPIN